MIYGYSRCSTNETKQDLDRQSRELRQAGAEIIFEEFEHGDSEVKRELAKLLKVAQAGDTIIVTEVSRLARSTKQLCSLIDFVRTQALCLQILGSVTVDCRNGEIDPMTKAFLQMAGVFSELELAMIRARVKSGMANARAKGKQIGRPKLTKDSLPDKFYRHYPLFVSGTLTKKELSALLEVSRPTLDKWLTVAEAEGLAKKTPAKRTNKYTATKGQ